MPRLACEAGLLPMRIIQQQLGHASLATTDRYLAHIAPREVIEAMRGRDWSIEPKPLST